MTYVIDRRDPEVQHAMDLAARLAEHDITRTGAEWDREHALDVCLAHTTWWKDEPSPDRLAWALTLLEKQQGILREHERRLLDDSWEKVIHDAEHDRWNQLGS